MLKEEYAICTSYLAEKRMMYITFFLVIFTWFVVDYFRFRKAYHAKINFDKEVIDSLNEEREKDSIEEKPIDEIIETKAETKEKEADAEIDEPVDDSLFFVIDDERIGLFKVDDVKPHTYIAPNFQLIEFLPGDGAKINQKQLNNAVDLAGIFQIIRNFANSGRPAKELRIFHVFRMTSGCRSPERNLSVGGAPLSTHIDCKGGDFIIEGFTAKQTYRIVEHLIKTGEIPDGGLGLYSTHVHYDTGKPRRW